LSNRVPFSGSRLQERGSVDFKLIRVPQQVSGLFNLKIGLPPDGGYEVNLFTFTVFSVGVALAVVLWLLVIRRLES
jgi:hypothetical protein